MCKGPGVEEHTVRAGDWEKKKDEKTVHPSRSQSGKEGQRTSRPSVT